MRFHCYKLELKLNEQQRILCFKSAGTSRFAYNWMLSKLNENYEKEKLIQNTNKPKVKLGSAIDWHKKWVILKEELPWIREVAKDCGQESLRNLEYSFKRFFQKKTKYPKFKKRGNKDSFSLSCNIFISTDYIQLPKMGKIKLKEKKYPIKEGKLKLSRATVSRHADRWFVSFFIKEDIDLPKIPSITEIEKNDVLGVDLGIKELAITSDGETFNNPKAYKSKLKKLKRYQRRVSRKQKGSNNKKKAITRLSKIHKKISDIRNDTVQKLTTSLVKTKPKMIVIETLKPKNMSKNHKLAGAILDSAFGKIKDTLKYKCEWNGIHLIMAPQFYASSKYCSSCGYKHNDLKLSDRKWICKNCGIEHDRDINAAKNLQFLGRWLVYKHSSSEESTVGSMESYACGDERLQFLIERCSSMKQEFKSQNSGTPSFV